MESKWIKFTVIDFKPKTTVWEVSTKDDESRLGRIGWFGRWRSYAFFPYSNCLFEKQCLRDIADFIEYQNNLVRQNWKKKNGKIMKLETIKKIYDLDKILEGIEMPEHVYRRLTEALAEREDRIEELEKMPAQFEEFIKDHRQAFSYHGSTEIEKVQSIVANYRSKALRAIIAASQFRDRFLNILHGLELIFNTAGSAWTRHEMAARLRGFTEFIQTQIRHLERMKIDMTNDSFDFEPNNFFGLSDSPVREVIYRKRQLESELAESKKEIARLKGEEYEVNEAEDVYQDQRW